jgi:hypothetical protein
VHVSKVGKQKLSHDSPEENALCCLFSVSVVCKD